ncbi:MAG TPA: GNAT family N-acetyltransferase [Xanthobacteraceae bacterium]|nr:GNAT family N-acetyltransferase [Xanthobacteraceae bacterium]
MPAPPARSGLILRLAAPTDRPFLLDLWVAGWQATLPDIDFAARRAWFAAHLDTLEEAGAETWVALGDTKGAPLGFVTVSPHTGYIDQLALAPASWGSGVAAVLLAQARLRAPGRLALHVNTDNPRAVRFYEREGFRRAGEAVNPRSGLPIYLYEWTEESA